MKYAAIIEKTGNGYSAYVPDLPGCVAAGDTPAETEGLIQEAVLHHIDMLRESATRCTNLRQRRHWWRRS